MEPHHTGRLQELATRIYVELVARNTEFSAGSVIMKATASNLATLSLRLAEAFLNSEAEAISARQLLRPRVEPVEPLTPLEKALV